MTRRPILGALLTAAGLGIIGYAVWWIYSEHSGSFVPNIVIVCGFLVGVLGINFLAAPRKKP